MKLIVLLVAVFALFISATACSDGSSGSGGSEAVTETDENDTETEYNPDLSSSDAGTETDENDTSTEYNPDLSFENIQAMIDDAQDGDTIIFPEGTNEWTSAVSVPDDKKLILEGAGVQSTIIISDLAPVTLDLNESGSRVTQICFKLKNDLGWGIETRGDNWRIDHCKFDFLGETEYTIEGIKVVGGAVYHSTGVIDHCEFNDIRILVYGQNKLLANEVWNQPLDLGSDYAVFVEDCVFSRFYPNRNIMDSNYGARYVFRYNTVNDAYTMTHSVQGNNRSARSWEIYNNTINQVNL